jgi:hypothetical protein
MAYEYEPLPADFLILELLPDQGLIGGIHYKGRLVREVRKDLVENSGIDVPTSLIQTRMRSMALAGLVRKFTGATTGRDAGKSSTTNIWARTPKGKTFMGRKDEFLGGLEDDLDTEGEVPAPELSPNHPASGNLSDEEFEESGYDGPMVQGGKQ